MQRSNERVIQSITSSFGPKPSKEEQATLKSIETMLADYTSKMVPKSDGDDQNEDPTTASITHSSFKENFQGCNPFRLNVDELSEENVVQKVIEMVDDARNFAGDTQLKENSGDIIIEEKVVDIDVSEENKVVKERQENGEILPSSLSEEDQKYLENKSQKVNYNNEDINFMNHFLK